MSLSHLNAYEYLLWVDLWSLGFPCLELMWISGQNSTPSSNLLPPLVWCNCMVAFWHNIPNIHWACNNCSLDHFAPSKNQRQTVKMNTSNIEEWSNSTTISNHPKDIPPWSHMLTLVEDKLKQVKDWYPGIRGVLLCWSYMQSLIHHMPST